MKLRWLVIILILPLLWIGCEDEKEEEEEVCVNFEICCATEVAAMETASDALEAADSIAGMITAIATSCTAIDDVIKCAKDSGVSADEISDLEDSYDEICSGS